MASAVVGTLRVLLEANAANLEATFDKASIKVGDFDRFSKNAIRNLTTTVAQFSGQNIVAEATRMAAAVEKVGGVSSLTAREIARVTSVTNEAVAKLKALGAEVPPSIAKLHTEIGTLGTKSSVVAHALGLGSGGLGGALKALGPILPFASIAGLSTALIGMGRNALNSADQIVTLSNKTGLSIQRIQEFQFVAGQTGTTVDALAAASFKLGVNIENGTTKARSAIAQLGLSYEDLKKQSPEQQFDTVIGKLEGLASETERNAIGAALFGKGFSEVATIVAEGYTRMKDEAVKSTDGQILALANAEDALDKFQRKFSVGFTSMAGAAVMWVEAVERGADSLSNLEKLKLFLTSGGRETEDYLERLRSIGQGLIAADEQTKQWNDALKKQASQTNTTAKAVADYSAQLAAAQREVSALSGAQRTQLNAALKLGGEAAKDYAESIGLSEEALRLYQSGLHNSTRATKDHSKGTDEAARAQQRFLDSIKNTTPALTAFFTELKVGVQDSRPAVFLLAEAITDVADAAARAKGIIGDGLFVPLKRGMPGFSGSENEARESGQETGRDFSDAFDDKFQQQMMAVGRNALAALRDGMLGRGGNALDVMEDIGTQFGVAIGGAIGAYFGGPAGELFGEFIGSFLGPAVAKLGELFGMVSREVQKARSELVDFQQTLRSTLTDTQKAEAGTEAWKMDVIKVRDAYLATGRTAAEAEAIVRQLWDTDHPEAMRRAIAEINLVLEEEKRLAEEAAEAIRLQEQAFADAKEEASGLVDQIVDLSASADGLPKSIGPYIDQLLAAGLITEELAGQLRGLRREGEVDWEAMQAAAERYGVDLDSLGGRFQGARLHRSAQEIINDFGLLTRGGADVGGVLLGMSDEIANLVRDSIKFGTTIPANMRPWIQELSRSGRLLDENGNKIENLDKLNFGEELKDEAMIAREGFAGIIAKLDELIARITGPLTAALDNITKDRTVNIDVDYRFTEPPIQRDDPTRNIPFARGGLVTSATRALIGEAGPELVIPLSRLPEVVKTFTGAERSGFSPDMRIIHPPIPDYPRGLPYSFGDRTDDRAGNRDAGGERNTTNVHPVIVFVPQSSDPDAIIDEMQKGFGQAVALDRHGLRVQLKSLLLQGAG